MPGGFSENTLHDLLPEYYKRLFPHYLMCKWLGYSEVQKENFHRREFSFTLKDDIYLRYQTFYDWQDFEKELLRRLPIKIDIGSIYNHVPKDVKSWQGTGPMQVEERELVFDIDMTDYDDVRYCCSGSEICINCWPLMQFAIKILDAGLEEDFGFEHRLWIYSGRRGVHCWVADESARKLSSTARSAIVEYFTLVKGGDSTIKKVNFGQNMHPSIKRATRIVQKGFEDYACNKQNFLADDDKINKLLLFLPNQLKEDFGEKMRRCKTSVERWRSFQNSVKNNLETSTTKKGTVKLTNPNLIDEIMFQFCYPRLDVEVTKGLNHLLKSPFCVHPKTGRVCVPIDLEKIDQFDPFNVPMIDELCAQLERCDLINLDKKIKDYKKTDLKQYIETFERFIQKLELTWKGKNLMISDLKGVEGDF